MVLPQGYLIICHSGLSRIFQKDSEQVGMTSRGNICQLGGIGFLTFTPCALGAGFLTTKAFPQDEKFALVSQMRRSAYSIPSNLMEGGHRLNKKEYRQFVGIAKGSVGELKYFLLLSKDLAYIPERKYLILRESAEELSKMLSGLIKSLTDTDTGH